MESQKSVDSSITKNAITLRRSIELGYITAALALSELMTRMEAGGSAKTVNIPSFRIFYEKCLNMFLLAEPVIPDGPVKEWWKRWFFGRRREDHEGIVEMIGKFNELAEIMAKAGLLKVEGVGP